MTSRKPKTSRLQVRLPKSIHRLLRQAADLQGRSLSEFVVSSSREAAERAITNHGVLRLSRADQQRFAAQLLKPNKPTAAMQRAAKLYANWIEPS